MGEGVPGRTRLALVAAAVLAVVVVWFGIVMAGRPSTTSDQVASGPSASAQPVPAAEPARPAEAPSGAVPAVALPPAPREPATQEAAKTTPQRPAPQEATKPEASRAEASPPGSPPQGPARPEAPRQEPARQEPARQDAAKQEPAKGTAPEDDKRPERVPPSFDIVRVEPSGESVVAGRGVAGATVELVRNGRPFARAAADMSGLFAFTPPPLPPGTHDISLQTIAPDGTRAQSRESVTVVVSAGRDQRPLVALSSPDKPTVVLSQPEAGTAAPPPPAPARDQAVASLPEKPRAPRPEVKVTSVEAEDAGRLFVTGRAAAGASVRLYLNDALIAPGGAGEDGRVSFAIGKGVKPGEYKVRLDDVDPVSGQVRSRAEVAFTVPVPVNVPLPPPVPPVTTDPPALAQVPPAGQRQAVRPPPARPEPAPTTSATPAPSQALVAAPRPVQESVPPVAASPAPGGSSDAGRVAAAAPAATVARPAAAIPEPVREADPNLVVVPEINTAIVSRGDNLWRISRRIYGQGVRYTVIYGANQEQIRNPRLIYPGQVFVLPSSP